MMERFLERITNSNYDKGNCIFIQIHVVQIVIFRLYFMKIDKRSIKFLYL